MTVESNVESLKEIGSTRLCRNVISKISQAWTSDRVRNLVKLDRARQYLPDWGRIIRLPDTWPDPNTLFCIYPVKDVCMPAEWHPKSIETDKNWIYLQICRVRETGTVSSKCAFLLFSTLDIDRASQKSLHILLHPYART